MTDQELRALVRDAVARHMGRGAAPSAQPAAVFASPAPAAKAGHPSHAIYLSVVNTTEACVIEPDVPCNHCNYCRSHSY
jgi:hypothetical protein